MANVSLNAYKVGELVFNNKVNGKVQLKLTNKVSHNVRYKQDGTCEANLTVEAFDKEHKDVLNFKISLVGAFRIVNRVEKEFIHVETFRELYALARALTATVTGACGVPPIMLQEIDIEKQEIYRFEMNGKKEEDNE